MLQRNPPTTSSPENELDAFLGELGAEVPPKVAEYIDRIILGRVKNAWDAHITAYSSAVENFETYMQFPSDAEANAKYLDKVLSKGAEELFKKAVEKSLGTVPGFGIAYDMAKGVLEEAKRAAAAASQIQIRDFIVNYRHNIVDLNTQFLTQIGGIDAQIRDKYVEKAQGTTEEDSTSDISIAGVKYLREVRQYLDDYMADIPSAASYTQSLVEAWVSQSQGARWHGLGTKGKIYISVDVSISDDMTDIKVTIPDTAELASNEADKAASALNNLMAMQNLSINDLNIDKNLMIAAWHYNGLIFGGDVYRYNFYYNDPDEAEDMPDRASGFGNAHKAEDFFYLFAEKVRPMIMAKIKKLEPAG